MGFLRGGSERGIEGLDGWVCGGAWFGREYMVDILVDDDDDGGDVKRDLGLLVGCGCGCLAG